MLGAPFAAGPAVDAAVDEWLATELRALGRSPGSLDPAADLHDEGLLDSVSLVELLRRVEHASGREVDLLDVDLDALTTRQAVKDELRRVLSA